MAPEELERQAISYAKSNRTRIARELTDKNQFPPDTRPVSVFMAGSPGAGKTEASKAFLEEIGADNVLRLDPDELRELIPGYTGDNSYLFHRAVSFIVERTLDHAFKNKQSFLLDGTLASYDVAKKNIERSIRKERQVLILFVYQKPELAWEFVEAREKLEGRRILADTFIDQFFASQEVIRELKLKFGSQIQVDLLVKNNKGKTRFYHDNVQAIEHHLDEKFTREDLQSLIESPSSSKNEL
ncbi:zeta toxin family protein [Pseudoalteromonas sp. SR44-5]|uniref:zeta toxin family protein n=1 Tax=Pseudoalteromonas TaxID=53246 RepID=UPI00160422E7|nr:MULTISPECIES: zeta toxin family protein [unclassified Pseudoalteromonas]MBB1368384.1 zeta toxin family protein [Pseudoalteromonas sp. SR44-5]MBB1420472.1 zeta toxin family protein [Pseudoalteromonas sp. SG43-7]MBB1436242.1 zeta toxin family protein [Pseudoalteromonas sp. SG43-6]MBB1469602.1 zeta toxin family protein [Pseudoalteromonas sp. SG41-5]MBB1479065.1 zeta toxin family protein [Pseudoalteromonas sp. SG41-2]